MGFCILQLGVGEKPPDSAHGRKDGPALAPEIVLCSFGVFPNGIRYITNTNGVEIRPALQVGGIIVLHLYQSL